MSTQENNINPTDQEGTAARANRREDWLETREVADEYNFNVNTLRYWRHIGYGPASFKRGRKVCYRRRGVEAWIEEQERLTQRGDAIDEKD